MGEGGIFKQLTKALIEQCLSAELDTHLAEEKAEAGSLAEGTERPKNRRNGPALDKQYPTISQSWINPWSRIIPFFAFPPDIRKAIYTNNAIESMNMTLRKVLRNHRSFPTFDSYRN